MTYTLLHRDDLPFDGSTYEFIGAHYQNTEVSFIWVDMPPGGHVRLHTHPYAEIFIIQEGIATYTVGTEIVQAHAGQIIIVPAEMPHKFVNSGAGQLRQVDIHVNKEFVTVWLED